MPDLFTIGHSTRSSEEFFGILRAHGVQALADVRLIPFSRRNPQFHQDALKGGLPTIGIAYRHLPQLGGRRRPLPDSVNQGWRNASFRGYADYMQTQGFQEGLGQLVGLARETPTSIMCAEAVPWRCHRSLIADALVAEGWAVFDLLSVSICLAHRMTPFGTVPDVQLIYLSSSADIPRLL